MIKAPLEINHIPLKNIAEYSVSYEDVINSSITSVDGIEYKDIVGTKRIINITIGELKDTEMETLLSALETNPAEIKFIDAKTKLETTSTFYRESALSAKISHWRLTNHWYGDISIQYKEVGLCE